MALERFFTRLPWLVSVVSFVGIGGIVALEHFSQDSFTEIISSDTPTYPDGERPRPVKLK